MQTCESVKCDKNHEGEEQSLCKRGSRSESRDYRHRFEHHLLYLYDIKNALDNRVFLPLVRVTHQSQLLQCPRLCRFRHQTLSEHLCHSQQTHHNHHCGTERWAPRHRHKLT